MEYRKWEWESDGYSLGHDFVGASCVIAGKCSRCDERKTTEHNFEDGICIVCGKKQEIQKKKVETKGNNSYIYLDSSDYDFSRAVVAAQSLVKDRLNSPSTAKFPFPIILLDMIGMIKVTMLL